MQKPERNEDEHCDQQCGRHFVEQLGVRTQTRIIQLFALNLTGKFMQPVQPGLLQIVALDILDSVQLVGNSGQIHFAEQ
ncbi:hypothetical protein D3C73_1515090 [compost metagenome]